MTLPVETDPGGTAPADPTPRVVVPELRAVFADRSMRFRQLARGRNDADYLVFLSTLAAAQHAVAGEGGSTLDHASGGDPPLDVTSLLRHVDWHVDLDRLLTRLRPDATGNLLAVVEAMDVASRTELDVLAVAMLEGAPAPVAAQLAWMPIVAAALQVTWTRAASKLDPARLRCATTATQCPACGYAPVASVVQTGGERTGRRYLQCALCACEWYLVRVSCSTCGATDGVSYLKLEAEGEGEQGYPTVRAEICDACRSYLKVIDRSRDGFAEAHADDLASLALDVLVGEHGYQRSGPNLLFAPGTTDD
ncbi:MAG: formate dehydrogenase accessory protein FdhE [Ectothiorhodospiraceae bacterium]|nr:formate dehydrogenase accessory protein FdhE [Ectothiorhodospiraceae bacterium]